MNDYLQNRIYISFQQMMTEQKYLGKKYTYVYQ